VTTAERNSLGTTFTNGTPTDHIGLQVWDTTIDAPYVWDGSAWVRDALVVNGDVIFQGTINPTNSASVEKVTGYQYVVDTAGTLPNEGGTITYSPSANVEIGDMVLFTSATEATVLQRNLEDALVDADFASAGIMATNGSGTYSIITDNSTDWNAAYNDKINSASFNITDGVLTLTQQDGGTVTVDLDGRYLTEQIAEVNDLTASVTWANVPDANITQSSVTQHEGALSITESQISDLQSYLTTETNDLTAAVTWANVPDANITQSSVTQHEGALSITESQISDLQSYLLNINSENIGDLANVTITAAATGDFLRYNGAAWVDSTIQDGDIAESAVTQHEAALSIAESQISLTNSLAAGFTATDLSGAVNELEGEINALQGRDEVATYTATGISITASTPFTVNHNLALSDKDFFTIRVCDSNGSSISVDVDSVNTNSLTLTSLVDLTGIKVFIIGVPA
jgi:hypothetical protein